MFGIEGQVENLVYLATPLPERGLPTGLILQLAGAGLGAAFLAGLASMLLSRRIARPLEELDRAALAISEGDLSRQVPDRIRRDLEFWAVSQDTRPSGGLSTNQRRPRLRAPI